MGNNITLVSSPDELVGGDIRLLLAGVSDARVLDIINYFSTQSIHTVIHSITNDDFDWIFRTAQTCDIIIVDLERYNDNIAVGWLLKDSKTVWYGNTNLECLNYKKIKDPLTYILSINKERF